MYSSSGCFPEKDQRIKFTHEYTSDGLKKKTTTTKNDHAAKLTLKTVVEGILYKCKYSYIAI